MPAQIKLMLREINKLLVILSAIVAITIVQVDPAQADLRSCEFRGTNAMEYYKCSVNINQFTVDGYKFTQPGGKGCVWVNGSAGYHFTSATSDVEKGDVHITIDGSGKHCGLNIVALQDCRPTEYAYTYCSTAQLTDAIAACEAFLIAGNCKF
ncbi:MAG TPA: hypothetical protein VK203_31040 [Nostocaceae cyanobacterium]|nr:hypothetical protein [Nostocaceae cyanobacterium]